jgi:hypothetical protein
MYMRMKTRGGYMGSTSKYLNEIALGQKFGRWTAYDFVKGKGEMKIAVRCDCGTKAHVSAYNLVKGRSTKCKNCRDGKSPSVFGASSKVYKQIVGSRECDYTITPGTISESFSFQSGICALTGETLISGTSAVKIDNAQIMTPENTLLVSNTVAKAMGGMDVKSFVGLCNVVVSNAPPMKKKRVTTQDFFDRREQQ